MPSTLSLVATVAALSVLAVLVVGIWNMGRENSHSLSQRLMRWRVGLQFVAVVLLMATLAVKRGF